MKNELNCIIMVKGKGKQKRFHYALILFCILHSVFCIALHAQERVPAPGWKLGDGIPRNQMPYPMVFNAVLSKTIGGGSSKVGSMEKVEIQAETIKNPWSMDLYRCQGFGEAKLTEHYALVSIFQIVCEGGYRLQKTTPIVQAQLGYLAGSLKVLQGSTFQFILAEPVYR